MNANSSTEPLASSQAGRERTLVERVRGWAALEPARRAYVSITDGKERVLTYGELDRRARELALLLASRQERGTNALLLYPLGLDFIEAFFGCLYAGIVAVPVHPGRGPGARARLGSVLRDCGARSALTTSGVAGGLSERDFAELELVETDRVTARATSFEIERPDVALAPEFLAFLQYTSGSTSEPKGTMVTHGNMLANLRMMNAAFGTSRSTVIASWLPVFHDMGLIGNVLHAAYLGGTAVLLSTLAFLKSPIVWLRAIQDYGAEFSGGPNFAYDLCVTRTTPAERAGLDLSSWRVAFNGSEPVRHRTLERFARTFAPFGFRESALVPTYGLAEATLMVSGSNGRKVRTFAADARKLKEGVVVPATRAADAQVLVGNGRVDVGDQVVAIVEPESRRRAPAAQVGEIWVAGAHVARGYWQKREASAETFHAELEGDARAYLRTGDLGFLHDGELFVAGRIKDLVIVRGQNIHPQDLELTVETACPALHPGSTAAFAVDDDALGVVVVAELERGRVPAPDELERVAFAVQAAHEVTLQRLVLVRRNTVPKTTSGKIQRQRCKAAYQRGDYEAVVAWEGPKARDAAQKAERLAEYAARWLERELALPLRHVERTASFAALGLDSIRKVALVSSIEKEFGLVVPDDRFFALETLADLTAFAAQAFLAPDASAPRTASVPSERREQATDAVFPAFSTVVWEVDDE